MHEVFGPKFLVLESIVPLFVSGNMKTETIKPKVNNILLFPYNLVLILSGNYYYI